MSAPLIWILFPGLFAALLYGLRRWQRFITAAGILVAVLLAWLAWQLPIGQSLSLGTWPSLPALTIADTLTILGRRFVLDNTTRPILILLYLGMALWFGGAYIAHVDRLFIPIGLGIAVLLTAALAVEPFLYAALLFQITVLGSVAILSPPGQPVGRGVLRFLTLQSLGMPFILFAGWQLSGLEASPGDASLIWRVTLFMGLGFAFLMAVFPFHTWIPMLAEEAHPYAAAFIFFVLPTVVSLFALTFLTRYTWLSTETVVFTALRFTGALMVVLGGLWAAFENHLGRIMGYAATVEIGLSLLALSLGGAAGAPALIGISFALLLPRGIALAVWALALSALLPETGGLRFRQVQGIAHRLPVAAASLALANFSLAGFPLLAGFPVRVALWSTLAQQSLPVALLALAGSAGLLTAGLRTLAVLVTSPGETGWRLTERRPQLALLSLGWLMLFIIGLLPHWFLPSLAGIVNLFAQPVP